MIRENQRQENRLALSEGGTVDLPKASMAGAPRRWPRNRCCPVGAQTEKFHPQAVKRLYLAIVNRAILDVLENGPESRTAERWLLGSDFDGLRVAVD